MNPHGRCAEAADRQGPGHVARSPGICMGTYAVRARTEIVCALT